jgi:hypothetical protein
MSKQETKSLHTAKEPTVMSIDTCTKLIDGVKSIWTLTGGKDGSAYIVDEEFKVVANAKTHKKVS